MKKFTLLFFLSLRIALPYSFSQEKEFSHWSLTLEAGTNVFDGDVYQEPTALWKNIRGNFSLGTTVEYNFNPLVSMGLSYYHLPINANNSDILFHSTHNQIYPFLSWNLLRIFNHDTRTKWGIWAIVGLGTSAFSGTYYSNEGTIDNPVFDSDKGIKSPTDFSIIVPVGINIEYNFTKNIALGLKALYTSNNRDDLEFAPRYNYKGVTNDFVSVASLALRWKFKAKEKDHLRNVTWSEFQQEKRQALLQPLNDELKKLRDLTDSIAKQLAETPSPVVEDKANKDNLAAIIPPSSPADNANKDVDKDKDFIIYDPNLAVFFDFDKTDLDDQALETIFLVAKKMQADPAITVEVIGFTDYMGSDNYNLDLSIRRSERVKQELVKTYSINTDRIIINGSGKILNPKNKYRPNRRAEFIFSKD